ncbi:MAG: ASPIC/UnbV domain-containing protein [Pirellulales bacterium]
MSQTPTGSGKLKPSEEYLDAWDQLAQMIQEGRSFSGRERNCCFLNTRGPRFADVSAATGLDFDDDARAVAVADWDHDGDLDLWVSNRTSPRVRFLRNDVPTDAAHLTLELIGDPARATNRDAIGARVEVHLSGNPPRTLVKALVAGDGFLSQSSKQLHFGLGGQEAGEPIEIDRIVVRWPTAKQPNVETFSNVAANGRYRIVQGTGKSEQIAASPRTVVLNPSALAPPAETSVARVKLLEPLPIEPFEYRDLDGRINRSSDFVGAPVLINFWSTTCAPCVKELREFSTEKPTLDRLKVRIVALNVDAMRQSEPPTAAALKTALANLKYEFESGWANKELLDAVDKLQRSVVYRQRTLPLPMSVLIDPAGRGSAIYFGPVTPRVLLADVLAMAADPATYRQQAVPFRGRWARDLFESHPIAVASAYLEGGYPVDARAYIDKFLAGESAPPSVGRTRDEINRNLRVADMHHMIGRIAEFEAKPGEAAAAFRRALDYHAEHAAARADLAWLLATSSDAAIRNGGEAVRLVEPMASGGWGDEIAVFDALAAAHAENGKFVDAVRAAETALAAAEKAGDASRSAAVAARLALYRASRPYRSTEPRPSSQSKKPPDNGAASQTTID